MKITKIDGLGDYGVYIDDVDFNHMTDEEWMRIGQLHLDKLVTIIRNSNLTWENQPKWVTKFGDTRHVHSYNFIKKYNAKNYKELAKRVLSDDPTIDEADKKLLKDGYRIQQFTPDGKHSGRVSGKKDKDGNPLGMFAEGELLWHSNESGTLTFTPGVTLLGAENMIGTATGFVQTANYYQDIDDSFRSELDEMILVHKFTPGKINPGLRGEQDEMMHSNMCPEDGREIPLVIQSPGGIKGLHYSINTINSIRGMSEKESQKVFDRINKELFVDKYMYDHWYKSNNDFLLFDNSITLHRRLGDVKDRLGYRIQHDYSNLQDEFWQPYFQKEFADEYEELITEFVTTMNIKDFKLPKSA